MQVGSFSFSGNLYSLQKKNIRLLFHIINIFSNFATCFRAQDILIAHFSAESPPRKKNEHEQPIYGEVRLSVDFSIVYWGLW